jgi:acyl-CoA synthetase (AMP-forming)/AMP-acid ligase II
LGKTAVGKESETMNVVSKFEETAERYPDEIAIHTWKGALTYAELNSRANRLAHAILSWQGPGNDAVLLMYKHGLYYQMEAILGVLKAGKAIAAINVDRQTIQTGQRGLLDFEFMDDSAVMNLLSMSGSELILCDRDYHEQAHRIGSAAKIRVENTTLQYSGQESNPNVEIKPNDLTAILHTTGTTGEARAVKRSHSMEISNILAANTGDGITTGPGDRSTLFRIANPAALGDSLYPLLWGGRLSIFNVFSGDLTEWVVRQKITCFRALGTVFRMLDYERGDGFKSVKFINVGGEMITENDIENYRCYFPDRCKFVIRYAASEAGVITQYVMDKDTPFEPGMVGWPVGKKYLGIINGDKDGIGEIAVCDNKGNLFSGYLNNPELTSKKLKDDGTVFLTGDRGRLRDDGCLIHLGRIV